MRAEDEADIYPNFVGMAKSFGVPSRRVIRKGDLRGALEEMLSTPGPYLLEVREAQRGRQGGRGMLVRLYCIYCGARQARSAV